MSVYLISGGTVVDPASGTEQAADVLVRDGAVVEIGPGIDAPDAERIDARALVVAPGLVDLHTHLREPGREDKETIATASAAAAAGGYTAVCAMPNTDPVADNAAVVESVHEIGRRAGLVEVVPAGAITRGLDGRALADIGEMALSRARVRLFTDDGRGVQDALLARRAMEYIVAFDGVYAEHCEDASLARGGVAHDGAVASRLGLKGIPAEAEEIMAARDVALARITGCRLHLLHVSTAGTVDIVRRAKRQGVPVTAEATPHHFYLTEDALEGYDPSFKVNPPLRSEHDRYAIVEGLADGTIDAVATDHAPHTTWEKETDFDSAPFGMVGLETALAVTITALVEPGHISLARAVALLSAEPARILSLEHHGVLRPGAPANIVVFDPAREWTIEPDRFRTKGRNSPFAGRTVRGAVVHTFFEGRMTVRDGSVLQAVAP